MLWSTYLQHLDPLAGKVFWSQVWSTLLAALPVVVLFWLLVPRRWPAPKAGAAAAITAWLIAVIIYGMGPGKATMAFVYGVGFGLLPVGWTIFNAMLLYNISIRSGQFDVIRRSIAGLSGDARVQAVLIGFSFGAFLEGSAGGGTPVAICGAIMVGLGFDPFRAAVLCLIANTSPVAYGGLGTPIVTLQGVTDIPGDTLSIMAGHQLPLMSIIIPLYMVRCMCSWKKTFEVWPLLLVAGGSFAIFQFVFATIHLYFPKVILWPMTDIGGGMFSLVVTAIFLRFWQPRELFHFHKKTEPDAPPQGQLDPNDPHAAAAKAMVESKPAASDRPEVPLTVLNVTLAWAPWIMMSVFLLLTGLVRQQEGRGPVKWGPIQTNYMIPIPGLHNQTDRDPHLHPVLTERHEELAAAKTDPAALERLIEKQRTMASAAIMSAQSPMTALATTAWVQRACPEPEKALFNFAWLTSPGTGVFFAVLLAMAMVRMKPSDIGWCFRRTFVQMKIPIPTISFMLGLSYITRYAGMDATLGVAFAVTGVAYPFFAAILGWLGVFLTGTDAGSNALFGSLQKITATEIYKTGLFDMHPAQLQVLICTANSTGGVMGKMIDAQSIVVSTAATNQLGREADIFKAVVWHSIILASIVGVLVLLQAYLLEWMVPMPP